MRGIVARLEAWLPRLRPDEGATAVEYALMLALIAMAVVVAVEMLGRSTSEAFGSMTFTP